MTSITKHLSTLVGDGFAARGLDPAFGEVAVSQRPELADFQCNGAMAAAKGAGRAPRDLAEAVVAAVDPGEVIQSLEVAGPGFINMRLTDGYVASVAAEMAGDERLGVPLVSPVRTIVDYGGPNVAKQLHVGHLRPAIIGESIKRMLRFAGHDVVGDVHLGDRGAPMGQLIAIIRRRQPDLPYFDPEATHPYPKRSPVTMDDLEALYPEAAGRAASDPGFAEEVKAASLALQRADPGYVALWQHFRTTSIEAMRRVYETLDVHFDVWFGEAQVQDRIPGMMERIRRAGVLTESQGALVVEVAEPTDTAPMPPLLLVRSDGGYLYATTDLATIEERVDDLGAEAILYVVDARQSLHFEQLFRACRRTGIAGPGILLEHDPFGTVNGSDGKPLRTRDGGLPALQGLIDEAVAKAAVRLDENDLAAGYDPAERERIATMVGVAALKYGDLANHRTSDYIFDLHRFVSFEGKTGPYLLYGAVRIRSILRNAVERGLAPGALIAPTVPAERNLMLRLSRLEDVLARATELRAPNHLAEYTYDVATDFNRFYEACHILSEPDPDRQASWLALVGLTLRVLELLLDLLAIPIPDRM
ncbi:arginine--tRNA ligase [soil metagenome]